MSIRQNANDTAGTSNNHRAIIDDVLTHNNATISIKLIFVVFFNLVIIIAVVIIKCLRTPTQTEGDFFQNFHFDLDEDPASISSGSLFINSPFMYPQDCFHGGERRGSTSSERMNFT